jgi:hypothetical protein
MPLGNGEDWFNQAESATAPSRRSDAEGEAMCTSVPLETGLNRLETGLNRPFQADSPGGMQLSFRGPVGAG